MIAWAAAASVAAAGIWLYGTPSGTLWRLERMSTADLTALTLANPSNTAAQRALGNRLLAEARPDEAAAAFAAATAVEPSTESQVLLARALSQAGRPHEALGAVGSLASSSASQRDARVLCAAGEAYYLSGALQPALDFLRDGLKQDESIGWAWATYAHALADSHKLEAGRDAARRAVRLAPRSSASWTALGYVHQAAGRTQDAAAAYRRATSLNTFDARASEFLALLLARTADYRTADLAVRRAEDLRPHSPLLPYARGLLLMRHRRPDQAVQQFRTAIERKPNFTDAMYNLSRALRFAGKTRESEWAARQFSRARDYEREITRLSIRAHRERTNADLWWQISRLAEANGDATRAEMARRKRLALLNRGDAAPSRADTR